MTTQLDPTKKVLLNEYFPKVFPFRKIAPTESNPSRCVIILCTYVRRFYADKWYVIYLEEKQFYDFDKEGYAACLNAMMRLIKSAHHTQNLYIPSPNIVDTNGLTIHKLDDCQLSEEERLVELSKIKTW